MALMYMDQQWSMVQGFIIIHGIMDIITTIIILMGLMFVIIHIMVGVLVLVLVLLIIGMGILIGGVDIIIGGLRITDLHITIMISIMEKEILITLLEELPTQALQQQDEEQQVHLLQAQLVEIQLLIPPLEDLQMI